MYNFETLISVKSATHEFLDYVENNFMYVEVWGHQEVADSAITKVGVINWSI